MGRLTHGDGGCLQLPGHPRLQPMEKALHRCSEAMNQWPPSLTALVSISFTLPEGGLRWQLEQDTLVPVPVNVCRACLIDPHSGLRPLPVCGHTERVGFDPGSPQLLITSSSTHTAADGLLSWNSFCRESSFLLFPLSRTVFISHRSLL